MSQPEIVSVGNLSLDDDELTVGPALMLAIVQQLTDGSADGITQAGRIGRFDLDHDSGLAFDLIPKVITVADREVDLGVRPSEESGKARLQLVVPRVDRDLVRLHVSLIRVFRGGSTPRVPACLPVAEFCRDRRQRSRLHGIYDPPDELGRVRIVGALCVPPTGLAAPASPSPEIHAPILHRQQDDVFTPRPDAERPDLVLAVLVGWRIVAEQLPMAIEPCIARPSHNGPRVVALGRCGPDDVDPVDILVADLPAEPLDPDLTVLLAFDSFEVSVDEPVLTRDEIAFLPAITLGSGKAAAAERRVLLGSTCVVLHPRNVAEKNRHLKPSERLRGDTTPCAPSGQWDECWAVLDIWIDGAPVFSAYILNYVSRVEIGRRSDKGRDSLATSACLRILFRPHWSTLRPSSVETIAS